MRKLPYDLSTVTTVAVDLAKHVFQVHGCDAAGKVVVAKALRRRELLPFFVALGPCLVGLEACGSAHHWGRASSRPRPQNRNERVARHINARMS